MKTLGHAGHREDAGQVAALVSAWAVRSAVRCVRRAPTNDHGRLEG
jgi:hypothetical protein